MRRNARFCSQGGADPAAGGAIGAQSLRVEERWLEWLNG
ncbi:hypothetical protein [Azospirillum doebereinerae]